MPVLEVTIVGSNPALNRKDCASRIAEASGAIFRSGPGSTWVVLHGHSAEGYAENDGGSGDSFGPVFIRVLKKSVPSGPDLKAEVEALTRAVAEVCGRDPGQVHVIYEPPAAGRVAFGGRLVD
jgi:phenylpyruvate tautomerase PptA (4-oxalocrotonate tautomerase family)